MESLGRVIKNRYIFCQIRFFSIFLREPLNVHYRLMIYQAGDRFKMNSIFRREQSTASRCSLVTKVIYKLNVNMLLLSFEKCSFLFNLYNILSGLDYIVNYSYTSKIYRWGKWIPLIMNGVFSFPPIHASATPYAK